MKQPKKLTRDQKIFLTKRGYKPDKYLYVREENDSVIFWDKNKMQYEIIPKIRI